MASHVFQRTCRTLYTCPNPPEPIFSQLPNSEQSKVLSSPIFPCGESRTSMSGPKGPPAGQTPLLTLFRIKTRHLNTHTRTHTCLLVSPSLFFLPCQAQCGPSLSSGKKLGLGWLATVMSLPAFERR